MNIKFNFEDLKLYQKALNYLNWVYDKTEKFPKHELFNLTSQFRRASVSITNNIAEGYSESKAMFIRYLRIARGSIRECVVCTTIAYNRTYINEQNKTESREKLMELLKMTNGLITYTKNK